MIPLERSNLRDALIGVAAGLAIAWALSGCSSHQPPSAPTVSQLAPEPAPTAAPAPRITGALVLAAQTPEVQRAIKQHGARAGWPTFRWPRERLVPYTEHMNPLTIDVATLHDTDLQLEPGETITGFALGDDERFVAVPMTSGDLANPTPHAIIKCKVAGTLCTAAGPSRRKLHAGSFRQYCMQRHRLDLSASGLQYRPRSSQGSASGGGDTWFTEWFMVETPEQSRYTTNLTMFHKNPELPEDDYVFVQHCAALCVCP